MPLSEEDLTKIGNMFTDRVKGIETSFKNTLTNMGKRLDRLEAGFANMSRVARVAITGNAKKEYDRLVRAMFDESSLVAVPPLAEDQGGVFTRTATTCTKDEVSNKVKNSVEGDVTFEIEPTKIGFRLMMASFSPQTRRHMAAAIISGARKGVQDDLGLYLQYDKPHGLRIIQKTAYKFLSVLKKRGGDVVQTKALKQGFLVVNGVRIAPEYLVPGQGY